MQQHQISQEPTGAEESVYRPPASDPKPANGSVSEGLTALSWLSYVLHLVVAVAAVVPNLQVSVVLLLLAFVLDLIKRSEAQGTWLESHFSYRISSVIWAGVLYLLTAPLWLLLVLPGWLAWCAVSLWFLYRIIRGMLALSKEQPV